MARIVSAQEVSASGPPAGALIDVRLPEDYAATHIPGAVSHCVFEVAFLDGILHRGLRKDQALCVYGAAADSHETRAAADKLERAGFTQVLEFRGGMEDWTALGNPVEGPSAPPDARRIQDGRHDLDLAESRVVWVGRNLVNKHWGQAALAGGHVEFRAGKPASGEAVLDMRRLTCSDLAGGNLHDVLIHHLESDDFFDVARFPEARYAFEEVEICSDKPGCRNLKLRGELTLRGITRPLVIEAVAGFTPEGKAAFQSSFNIDRTAWDVIYGSGKFFRKLAGHLVNDEIELQLRIVTAERVLG